MPLQAHHARSASDGEQQGRKKAGFFVLLTFFFRSLIFLFVALVVPLRCFFLVPCWFLIILLFVDIVWVLSTEQ